MEINILYNRLKEAYTEKNLNIISSTVIGLFKNKEYYAIRHLMKSVCLTDDLKETKINKVFSRLMMLYHPDKINQYLKEIDNCLASQDYDKMVGLSHILQILDCLKNETIESSSEFCDLFSDEMEYIFDENEFSEYNSFSIDDFVEDEEQIYIKEEEIDREESFLCALKRMKTTEKHSLGK